MTEPSEDEIIVWGLTRKELETAWDIKTNAPECREMFTRKCPVICYTLDGVCARFGIKTEKLVALATKNYLRNYG